MFKLQHDSGTFDFVINGGTLEHYSDKDIYLLIVEMLRVLLPEGTLVVVVPNLRNFDINIHKMKLKIKKITRNKLFKEMSFYGAGDERKITFRKLFNIIKDIKEVKNLKYIPHTIAIPKFIPRSRGFIFRGVESIFVKLGFNWANIFIINKK